MGGFGSGRPSGSRRDMVESGWSLDVHLLHKMGCLQRGWSGGLQWMRDGRCAAVIGLRAEDNCVHLSYRVRINGGEWEDVAEAVRIVRVPCRFGGSRPYFICPGVVDGVACGRRVAKLHSAGRYFLCRHCYRLAYASQSEGMGDRALRRANKIRQRLGGKPDTAAPFPQKPPNMWRSTYERLRHQASDAEITGNDELAMQAVHLDRKLERILTMLLGLKDLRRPVNRG